MKTLAERLKFAIEHSELGQSGLARLVGITPQSIQAITSGRVKSTGYMVAMARHTGVNARWLAEGEGPIFPEESSAAPQPMVGPVPDDGISKKIGNAPESINYHGNVTPIELESDFIIGEVQAGHWLEAAEWPQEEWMPVMVPVDPEFSRFSRFGVVVRGPSMNEIYPDGTALICVKMYDLGRDPIPGERVIVHRMNGHGLVEATVKEYHEENGKRLLRPRSTHPDFQEAIEMPSGDGDSQDAEIAVVGLVLYSIRSEKPFARRIRR